MSPNKRKKAAPSPRRKRAKKPEPLVEPKPGEPKPVEPVTGLPEGSDTEPYSGALGETGEPVEDAGPGRTWYQGSDGRYYSGPQSTA